MTRLGGENFRFYVISEPHGLVGATHDPAEAEALALTAAVNSGRTVYVHDRLEERGVYPALTEAERTYLANLQRAGG